jgi:hypothetical protein
VVDGRDMQLTRWQPLQGRSNITRPNAPPGAVFKLDDVTLVVPLDSHDVSDVQWGEAYCPGGQGLPRVQVTSTLQLVYQKTYAPSLLSPSL